MRASSQPRDSHRAPGRWPRRYEALVSTCSTCAGAYAASQPDTSSTPSPGVTALASRQPSGSSATVLAGRPLAAQQANPPASTCTWRNPSRRSHTPVSSARTASSSISTTGASRSAINSSWRTISTSLATETLRGTCATVWLPRLRRSKDVKLPLVAYASAASSDASIAVDAQVLGQARRPQLGELARRIGRHHAAPPRAVFELVSREAPGQRAAVERDDVAQARGRSACGRRSGCACGRWSTARSRPIRRPCRARARRPRSRAATPRRGCSPRCARRRCARRTSATRRPSSCHRRSVSTSIVGTRSRSPMRRPKALLDTCVPEITGSPAWRHAATPPSSAATSR